MEGSIAEVATLGLVHHMIHHECTENPASHVQTLTAFARRSDVSTLDFCLPYGEAERGALIPILANCGKGRCYATHLIPLRKLSMGSLSPMEQGIMRLLLADQLKCAVACGATEFIFASGADVPQEDRPKAKAVFLDLMRWLCRRANAEGVVPLLEPFDRTVDKKFLYGPSTECMEVVSTLAREGLTLGIEQDMAHVPLMGENFEHAIRTVAPALRRVHLGNCVKKDAAHPFYGDQHPPMGIPGGEIDVPQLTGILRTLVEVGFLSPQRKGALVMEMKPWPGKGVEETIQDARRRLDEAWAEV